MQRATLDELARDPAGRYVAGDAYAHFCAGPSLWGVVLWGRPDETQAYALGRSLILELGPPAMPHASLFDASRLVGSDPGAFRAAEHYVTTFADALQKNVRRLALVRPAGLDGAVVAGAFDVMPRPFPVRVCDDARAALAWLAEGHGLPFGPDEGVARIAKLVEEVQRTPRALVSLRAFLDAHLEALPAIDRAARAIGVSTRTLQRQLGEAGTTFSAEITAARIRAARRLLIETDASITAIAMAVGCKTPQHFSALFRREVGEPPTTFRRRHAARRLR